jgi:hypothetical protein
MNIAVLTNKGPKQDFPTTVIITVQKARIEDGKIVTHQVL